MVVGRGDQITADGEVLDGEVEVDESLVTGESEPAVRRPGDPPLSGSVSVSGKATMRVTQAGSESYAGRLTTEARAARTERTPLQLDVERLIYTTAGLVAGVSVIVAVAALGRHPDTGQVARAAAVLVALVPQGFAIMSTVSYATGALRISRAGALGQRISAVESISRVDALVLDKTGTITSPDLEVAEVHWLTTDVDGGRRQLLRALADCGTLLVVFLTQPERQGDRRPALLAIAVAALYALISALPLARSFFDLEPLPIADAVALALVAGAWALALLALRRLFRRLDPARRQAGSRAASRSSTTA